MLGWNESAWSAMLVGAALKSTVVLGAAWLSAFALRRQSASTRHLVWTAAAAALIALPVLSLSLPALRVRSRALSSLVPSITFQVTATARNATSAATLPLPASASHATQDSRRRPDFRVWIPRLWAAGSLLGLAHMLLASLMMRRLRRASRPFADPGVFQALLHFLGIRHTVDLVELPAGAMPMNFGILRPAVFVPAGAHQWSVERLRVVLLHELAHVKRGDVATNLLMRTALCLFWWNPLAWTAWHESVKERERAADDLVLAAGEAATAYAAHLLDIARSMQSATPVAWAAIAMARPSQLEGRLLAILDSRVHRKSAGPRAAALTALLAVALVAPFAAVQAQEKLDPVTAPVVDAVIQAATAQSNHEITDSAAAAYVSTRKYEAAQKLLENSLVIRGQASGEHSSAYAVGLMKLGELSEKRNKVADALDFYTRAAALGDTPETAPGLIYLASHALTVNDPVTAGSLIDRALAVAPKGALGGRAATVKGDVARLNGLAGVAEDQYLQALAQEPHDSPEAVTTMQKYASLLTSQNRIAEAQAMYARSRPVPPVSMAATGAFRVGGGVSAPVLLYKKEPEYTEVALSAKHQGTVVLYVQIGADGRASNIQVVKSLGLGLDEKAIDAVSQWRFEPGKKDGVPVTVEATLEVNFRLK